MIRWTCDGGGLLGAKDGEWQKLPTAGHEGLPDCAGYGAYPPVVASATTAASNAGLKGRAGVSSTLGGRPYRVAPLDPLRGFIPACRDFPWEKKRMAEAAMVGGGGGGLFCSSGKHETTVYMHSLLCCGKHWVSSPR